MFPVGLVPFPLDSQLLITILKSGLFLNPYILFATSFLITGFLFFKVFSVKILAFLAGVVFGGLISYFMYKVDKKGHQKQEKKDFIDYVDISSEVNNASNSEEKELTLSKIFKK